MVAMPVRVDEIARAGACDLLDLCKVGRRGAGILVVDDEDAIGAGGDADISALPEDDVDTAAKINGLGRGKLGQRGRREGYRSEY